MNAANWAPLVTDLRTSLLYMYRPSVSSQAQMVSVSHLKIPSLWIPLRRSYFSKGISDSKGAEPFCSSQPKASLLPADALKKKGIRQWQPRPQNKDFVVCCLPVLLLLQTIFCLLFFLWDVTRIGSPHFAQNLLKPFWLCGNRLDGSVQTDPTCISLSHFPTPSLASSAFSYAS